MNLYWFFYPAWLLVITGMSFMILGSDPTWIDPTWLNSIQLSLNLPSEDTSWLHSAGAFAWVSGLVLQFVIGSVAIDRILRKAA